MRCNHSSKALSELPMKCLNSIVCPMGHNTWSYVGNLCSCYNKDCWDTSFCGFCQHKLNCRHNNRITGFWLFALSFNKRFKGEKLASFATPLWENLSDSEKRLWRDKAKKMRITNKEN